MGPSPTHMIASLYYGSKNEPCYSTLSESDKAMPSRPMVMNLLGRLWEAGILTVIREGRGRRPQVLALAELVNLCEGSKVVR